MNCGTNPQPLVKGHRWASQVGGEFAARELSKRVRENLRLFRYGGETVRSRTALAGAAKHRDVHFRLRIRHCVDDGNGRIRLTVDVAVVREWCRSGRDQFSDSDSHSWRKRLCRDRICVCGRDAIRHVQFHRQ